MVMLKSFQRLGYFPHPELVPTAIIAHLRKRLNLSSSVSAIPSVRSIRYYQQAIRAYLGVKPYDKKAQQIAAISIAGAAEVMEHPADLINVAIEELVKERHELPAFSTLDRLVGHVRSVTNTRLFQRVEAKLSLQKKADLERLLLPESPGSVAPLNLLKAPPKSATLSHMKELQTKFERLMSFGDAQQLLSGLAPTKVKYFATLAKALDISEFQDIKPPKRHTLLLCLLYSAQVKTRDYLVEMFLKRLAAIHNQAKTRLVELREKHLAQTQSLLGVLAEILEVSSETPDEAALGKQVQSVLQHHGGTTLLLQQYSEIAAYNSNNHLPLMWRFYCRHRKVLFDLVRSLDIRSTTSDESLMKALLFVLDKEHRRSKWLPVEIDLSFISDSWRKLVVSRQGDTEVLVRQQLEKRAAADGSKFEVYENNLLSEYHIRYGGYGGIAYHHVSDTYIALFTHFITCGVWEAVYILDGLLKNTSDIQPDTLHADTQGQSAPVFALSYLLGIQLMPRIRNWQDYTFNRPSSQEVYSYIDPLFKGVVDWKLIKTHWQDLMRVVLSIKAGKLMPSTILRKLGSYSRKNRLYQAFRELGQVVRTSFLLRYISERDLRQQVTACTNKVEDYHRFLDWLFFGKDGVITENEPVEQEKRIKYLHLVAAAVILQNAVDLTLAIQTLNASGYKVNRALLATLSPYITRHIKRYGDYMVDLSRVPPPWEGAIPLPIEIHELRRNRDLRAILHFFTRILAQSLFRIQSNFDSVEKEVVARTAVPGCDRLPLLRHRPCALLPGSPAANQL